MQAVPGACQKPLLGIFYGDGVWCGFQGKVAITPVTCAPITKALILSLVPYTGHRKVPCGCNIRFVLLEQ